MVGDRLLSRDFEPYGIIFMNVCCYNRCHSKAVMGFWVLWDIYKYVLTALISRHFDGKFTSIVQNRLISQYAQQ